MTAKCEATTSLVFWPLTFESRKSGPMSRQKPGDLQQSSRLSTGLLWSTNYKRFPIFEFKVESIRFNSVLVRFRQKKSFFFMSIEIDPPKVETISFNRSPHQSWNPRQVDGITLFSQWHSLTRNKSMSQCFHSTISHPLSLLTPAQLSPLNI